MRAHVLSIGAELLLGHLTDTNATYLAQELTAHGIELVGVSQVGDNVERITTILRTALNDAGIIICTGGVGPTEDDLTREGIAALVGEEPRIDPEARRHIEAFFGGRGQEMPERNAKQAWLIPSAEALPNPVGTAPGWFVRYGDARIVAMPGVPREMFRMWREQALPRLEDAMPGDVYRSITFKTIGIGESAAEQDLADLVGRDNPVVATYAKDDGVHVRITAKASDAGTADHMRDDVAAEVRLRLAHHIYGRDDDTLPGTLNAWLARRDLKLGICETGSGGRLAALLESAPGAANAIAGGISYPNSESWDVEPSAGDLAAAALDQFKASVGIGLLVKASPDDNGVWSGETHITIRGKIEADDRQTYRAAFDDLNRRASLAAADLLRRSLASSD